jgi:hypothetical protein
VPPAIVPLALVALGVPAALRAILGRPRTLGSAWLAAAAASAVAQVAGEVSGMRVGVLGDAQLLLAGIGSTLTSALVALLERRAK